VAGAPGSSRRTSEGASSARPSSLRLVERPGNEGADRARRRAQTRSPSAWSTANGRRLFPSLGHTPPMGVKRGPVVETFRNLARLLADPDRRPDGFVPVARGRPQAGLVAMIREGAPRVFRGAFRTVCPVASSRRDLKSGRRLADDAARPPPRSTCYGDSRKLTDPQRILRDRSSTIGHRASPGVRDSPGARVAASPRSERMPRAAGAASLPEAGRGDAGFAQARQSSRN
jgi:hypothetical protein